MNWASVILQHKQTNKQQLEALNLTEHTHTHTGNVCVAERHLTWVTLNPRLSLKRPKQQTSKQREEKAAVSTWRTREAWLQHLSLSLFLLCCFSLTPSLSRSLCVVLPPSPSVFSHFLEVASQRKTPRIPDQHWGGGATADDVTQLLLIHCEEKEFSGGNQETVLYRPKDLMTASVPIF